MVRYMAYVHELFRGQIHYDDNILQSLIVSHISLYNGGRDPFSLEKIKKNGISCCVVEEDLSPFPQQPPRSPLHLSIRSPFIFGPLGVVRKDSFISPHAFLCVLDLLSSISFFSVFFSLSSFLLLLRDTYELGLECYNRPDIFNPNKCP